MSFEGKMEVAALVLEYLKVALGYSVTIPVLVAILCWLFRVQLRRAIDAMGEASWGSVRVKLRKRALMEYNASAEATKTATAYATVKGFRDTRPPALAVEQEKTVEAIASLFGLAARLLPLIPKADRHAFIEAETATLPPEFATFREALFLLAERAPDVGGEAPGLGDFFHAGE